MDVNEYKIKITNDEKEFVRVKVEDFLEHFERARLEKFVMENRQEKEN